MQDDFEDWMDARAREFQGEWFDAKVVGLTYPNADGSDRQEIARELQPQDELRLSPEPENRFDKHAIALLAPDGRQIGYCDSRLAGELTRRLAQGLQIRAYVRAVRERNGQIGVGFGLLQYKG